MVIIGFSYKNHGFYPRDPTFWGPKPRPLRVHQQLGDFPSGLGGHCDRQAGTGRKLWEWGWDMMGRYCMDLYKNYLEFIWNLYWIYLELYGIYMDLYKMYMEFKWTYMEFI